MIPWGSPITKKEKLKKNVEIFPKNIDQHFYENFGENVLEKGFNVFSKQMLCNSFQKISVLLFMKKILVKLLI
jgi:hypothetical protein